jgi:hypothetical protein
MGTEGRRNGVNEMDPSDRIYEYIVFRGSDVKDLRIEEKPEDKAPVPQHIPDDPAILGVSHCPSSFPDVSYDEEFRMLNTYSSESANPMWRFPLPSF